MLIGICDDDRLWCDRMKNILEEYGQSRNMKLEVQCFLRGSEMLEKLEGSPDVIFQDIEMGQEQGIDTAKQVNEKWKNCQVVYLTDYIQYALDVYQTEHVYYVMKNQFLERIDQVFERIFHVQEQMRKKLFFSLNKGKELALFPREILFFERKRRITEVVTRDGRYEIKDTIDKILEQLPQTEFTRCHNSYIVYFPAVRAVQKNCFLMEDGAEVLISRNYEKQAREAFLVWAAHYTSI